MTSFDPTVDIVLHPILPPFAKNDPRLVKNEIYVGIAYEAWRVGPMTEQWYGWNWSCGFGAGIQADHIDGPLYRFDPEQHLSTMHRAPRRPREMYCEHCGEPTPPGFCVHCRVLNE